MFADATLAARHQLTEHQFEDVGKTFVHGSVIIP
jgi:hypothetical protein